MSKKDDIYDVIFDIVRLIPKGRVTTYGAIAESIGLKSGARLVGYAMNMSHYSTKKVPAHRVVNRNGMLTGKHHFDSEKTMQLLLEKEGIKVINDCIIGFEEKFWDPKKEIKLQ